VVYRSKTPEHLSSIQRLFRGLRRRGHGVFLGLGLLAGACLDPKSDDLPSNAMGPGDDDNSPPAATGGPVGEAGGAGTGSGAPPGGQGGGVSSGSGGSGGAAGSGGAGGEGVDIDAGAPDAGPEAADAEDGASDAGTD
jgi:hypothetical protein